jgi:hypothetical protein
MYHDKDCTIFNVINSSSHLIDKGKCIEFIRHLGGITIEFTVEELSQPKKSVKDLLKEYEVSSKDLIGDRPINYKLWHADSHEIPKKCYAQDIDSVEYRFVNGNLLIVMICDTIQIPSDSVDKAHDNQIYALTNGKNKFYSFIAEKLNVPFFTVYHNEYCTKFNVVDSSKNKITSKVMSKDEYIEFIRHLGGITIEFTKKDLLKPKKTVGKVLEEFENCNKNIQTKII